MKRNCINCGAVVLSGIDKCPYCGTSYFDFSSIDFDENKPIILRIKYKGMIIEQLVVPEISSIQMERNTTDIVRGMGNIKVNQFINSENITTNITFCNIPQNNKIMKVWRT